MRPSPFRLVRVAWMLALGAVGAVANAPAAAQAVPERSWSAVPLLGFGVVRDGDWGSAGMEIALEIDYGGAAWRWSGLGSWRGLGVACSHDCFDGGPALAMGVARSVGPVWIGGGFGAMRQLGQWQALPYAQISWEVAPVRIDLRLELPRTRGPGLYVPVLVGIPLSP